MTRYAMVADLERCVGCQTCTAACRHANGTSPAVQWRRVLDIEAGSYPDVARTFVPTGCQHCDDPPCMHVCPTTATRKRADGIVSVRYDICIGCAYCDVACPYQARFKVSRATFAYGTPMRNEMARTDEHIIGVSQKCTFCSDRIDRGLAQGLVPGKDADATPACVNSCIADALHFGNLDDPESNVSTLLRGNTHFRMHEELGTAPRFYYLHDHRHGEAKRVVGAAHGPNIEPRHQAHWDWKAAANFVLGGCGASLLGLAALYGDMSLALLALAIIGAGLGVLFFKIGRPLRFLYVFRHPQRSWMSREAWFAVLLFPAALAMVTTSMASMVVVTLLATAGFLFSQAMILQQAKGIPVWRTKFLVPAMLLTGIAEGAAILSLLHPAPWLLASLIMSRAVAWQAYYGAVSRAGAPIRSLGVLRVLRPWLLLGGTVAPIAFVLLGAWPLTSLAVIASGWAFKFVLVTRAGYQQGFALEHAGVVLKPGWIGGEGSA